MKKVVLLVISSFIYQPVFALDVVVTIKPLHSLVQSILGEGTQADLLLDKSASPHDVQLKPSDIRLLNQANLVFMIDRKFEGFMQTLIKSVPPTLTIIEMSEHDEIMRLQPRDHKHAGQKDQDHADIDPHLWLSPENAKSMARVIATRLSEIDRANSNLYQANLGNTLDRLNQLDNDLKMRLSGLENLAFITQHDAYQYFENHYNLNFIRSLALDSSIPPSVKLALNIQKSIKEHDVRCIFREPQYSDRLVNTIAQSAAIKTGVLDPIGLELSPGPDLYFDLMNNLSKSFADCLAD
jgi:zinc transport system substrate-binding protein